MGRLPHSSAKGAQPIKQARVQGLACLRLALQSVQAKGACAHAKTNSTAPGQRCPAFWMNASTEAGSFSKPAQHVCGVGNLPMARAASNCPPCGASQPVQSLTRPFFAARGSRLMMHPQVQEAAQQSRTQVATWVQPGVPGHTPPDAQAAQCREHSSENTATGQRGRSNEDTATRTQQRKHSNANTARRAEQCEHSDDLVLLDQTKGTGRPPCHRCRGSHRQGRRRRWRRRHQRARRCRSPLLQSRCRGRLLAATPSAPLAQVPSGRPTQSAPRCRLASRRRSNTPPACAGRSRERAHMHARGVRTPSLSKGRML